MLGKRRIQYLDEVTDVIPMQYAKDWLNIARDDEDLQIESFIGAAINRCSNYLGYELRRCYAYYYFSKLTYLEIPAKVLNLISIEYQSDKDIWTTLSANDYYLNSTQLIPCVTITNVPSGFYNYDPAYRIKVEEGWYVDNSGSSAEAEDIIPQAMREAIMLTAAHLYGNRSDVTIINTYTLTDGAAYYLFPYIKLRIV